MSISYGIAQEIGLRPSMEDAHAIYDISEEGLFSAEVYDGHSGRNAADVSAEMLTPHFLSLLKSKRFGSVYTKSDYGELLREAYLATDDYIVKRGIRSGTAAATLHIFDEVFL
ncbi:MAG TPA: hypothetical protein VMT71_16670, partial [Syntrophorhabdales bacterium]|nr:hypothetical protein [Syntrophorhabdales bacterium]